MTGREWKPGDMALVEFGTGWEPALRVDRGWITGRYPVPVSDYEGMRPLVVIDPEEREQVARLAQSYKNEYWEDQATPVGHVDSLQAALRQFANPKPPKPEEPQGLGAVVEDAEGGLWVNAHPRGKYPWTHDVGQGFESCRYADIDAVTVLSEGVVQP